MKPRAIGKGTGRMLDKRGYVLAIAKGHPRANRDGYVWEHVLVAERAFGRHISSQHPVHHVDGNPANNAATNLVVCEDQAYHKLLHQRAAALEACGDASALKCDICKSYERQEEIRRYQYRKDAGHGARSVDQCQIGGSVMAEWSRGFPEKRGMYLVELNDGECIVTPWEDGKSYCEAEGEYRQRGWSCLKDWSGRVVRWVSIADIKLALNPILQGEEA